MKLLLVLLMFAVFFSTSNAGVFKKTVLVVGAVGAKKAFDKYARNKVFKSEGKIADKTIYQQEIDPEKISYKADKFNGDLIPETNLERMERGQPPYVEKNGKDESLVLHHSRQKDSGPIFELSKSSHLAKTGNGAEALHPYKTTRGREINEVDALSKSRLNPDAPVVRNIFDKERLQHWKDRAKEILVKRQPNEPEPSQIEMLENE
jgi:hypothetical protein